MPNVSPSLFLPQEYQIVASDDFYSFTDVKIVELAMLVTITEWKPTFMWGLGKYICFFKKQWKHVPLMALTAGRDLSGLIKEIKKKKRNCSSTLDLCKLQGRVGPNRLHVLEQHLTECIAAFCHLSFYSHDNKQRNFTRDIFKKFN